MVCHHSSTHDGHGVLAPIQTIHPAHRPPANTSKRSVSFRYNPTETDDAVDDYGGAPGCPTLWWLRLGHRFCCSTSIPNSRWRTTITLGRCYPGTDSAMLAEYKPASGRCCPFYSGKILKQSVIPHKQLQKQLLHFCNIRGVWSTYGEGFAFLLTY